MPEKFDKDTLAVCATPEFKVVVRAAEESTYNSMLLPLLLAKQLAQRLNMPLDQVVQVFEDELIRRRDHVEQIRSNEA